MLITGREARAWLAVAGVSDRRARIALGCGLAGPPLLTDACHLYDGAAVEELGARRVVGSDEMLERCPGGYVVLRKPVRVDVAHADLVRELSVVPGQISPWTTLAIVGRDLRPGGTALVGTVAGFVVLGATVEEARGRRLVLGPPGAWYDGLAQTQLLTGKGRQWKIVRPPRQPLAAA